jgi:hypothetical protein
MNGTIDVKNNPIVNCASVADAWMMGYPAVVQTNTIAANNMRLKPIAGTNIVDWEHDTVNYWNNRYVGVVYYINAAGQFSPLGGINSVSRPNGLQGVRIKMIEIIQNTPKSIMRCQFLDANPSATNSTVRSGDNNPSGFAYSSQGIIDSYNVSTFIRYGAGDYGITFVTPMADRNYAAFGNAGDNNGGTANMVVNFDFTNNSTAIIPDVAYYSRRTTNLLRFCTRYGHNNVAYDVSNINILVFGSSLQDNF